MFTEVDVLVYVIILLSTLTAFMRGIATDFLSLVVWFGTGFLTFYFYPTFDPITDGLFVSPTAGNFVAVIFVFFICYFIFTSIKNILLASLGLWKRGVFDRTLGLGFGIFKGLFIVSFIHFLLVLAVGGNEPSWLKEGDTYDTTHAGSKYIESIFGSMVSYNDIKPDDRFDNVVKTVNEQGTVVKEEVLEATGSGNETDE